MQQIIVARVGDVVRVVCASGPVLNRTVTSDWFTKYDSVLATEIMLRLTWIWFSGVNGVMPV